MISYFTVQILFAISLAIAIVLTMALLIEFSENEMTEATKLDKIIISFIYIGIILFGLFVYTTDTRFNEYETFSETVEIDFVRLVDDNRLYVYSNSSRIPFVKFISWKNPEAMILQQFMIVTWKWKEQIHKSNLFIDNPKYGSFVGSDLISLKILET